MPHELQTAPSPPDRVGSVFGMGGATPPREPYPQAEGTYRDEVCQVWIGDATDPRNGRDVIITIDRDEQGNFEPVSWRYDGENHEHPGESLNDATWDEAYEYASETFPPL